MIALEALSVLFTFVSSVRSEHTACLDGVYYTLHSYPSNFTEALRTCHSSGKQLAYPHCEPARHMVQALMAKAYVSKIWVAKAYDYTYHEYGNQRGYGKQQFSSLNYRGRMPYFRSCYIYSTSSTYPTETKYSCYDRLPFICQNDRSYYGNNQRGYYRSGSYSYG